MLDAYYGLESGAPGAAADGMLAMALGARALGEALIRGDRRPEHNVARTLSRVRRDNRLTQSMLTRLPVGLVAAIARAALAGPLPQRSEERKASCDTRTSER